MVSPVDHHLSLQVWTGNLPVMVPSISRPLGPWRSLSTLSTSRPLRGGLVLPFHQSDSVEVLPFVFTEIFCHVDKKIRQKHFSFTILVLTSLILPRQHAFRWPP